MTKKENLDSEIKNRIEIDTVERIVPEADRHPDIRAGICEFCGVSYRDCDHYQGMKVFCTYCSRADIVKERKVTIFSMKDNPHKFIVVCSDWKCRDAHHKRFSPKVVV